MPLQMTINAPHYNAIMKYTHTVRFEIDSVTSLPVFRTVGLTPSTIIPYVDI